MDAELKVRLTSAVLLAVLLIAPATYAQTNLNCSTIPGASNYGTDLSVCRMPDQSTLECSQDKGGMSYCQVQHANGFVSRVVPQSPIEGLGMLIGWMIHTHQQHVTDKAVNDAAASSLLLMKDSILSMDMSTLMERLASHVSPEQRGPGIEASKGFATASVLGSKNMFTLYAGFSQANNYSFSRMRKQWAEFHDTVLLDACKDRAEDRLITGHIDSIHASLPADIAQALEAIRADDALLEPECSSNRAVRLLQSRPRARK